MKKNYLLLLSVLIFSSYYGQSNFDQIVTGITVQQVNDNVVNISWEAPTQTAKFSIFYNKNEAITDRFILRASQLVLSSDMTGEEYGGRYQFSTNLVINANGDFYFAVIMNPNPAIDNMATGLVAAEETPLNYNLIPTLNNTVQAITINIKTKTQQQVNVPAQKIETEFPVVTSLALESEEDIFRLNWSVYPKTLSNYVFVIYRSRYPLTEFRMNQGLAEYVRVTNQFYFEDRSISFEIPYYYAVTAENSPQWDRGINVFTQPAVLIPNSPPFRIVPKLEFIKKKKKLQIQNSSIMSESEIQQAVQKTLENLRVIPVMVRENQTAEEIIQTTIAPLTPEEARTLQDYNNDLTNNFSRVANEARFQSINSGKALEQYAYTMFEQRNKSLESLDKIKQTYMNNEQRDFQKTQKEVDRYLQQQLNHLNNRKKLLIIDYLNNRQFKEKVAEYHKEKNSFEINQFKIQSQINNLKARRAEREKELINDLKEKARFIKKEQDKEYLDFVKKVYMIKREQYANDMAGNLFNKVTTLDMDNLNKKPLNQFKVAKLEQSSLQNTALKTELEHMESYLKAQSMDSEYEVQEYEDIPKPGMEEILLKQVNTDELKDSYQDVVVEMIPNREDLVFQNGIVVREIWINENKNIWKQKNEFWKSRIREILGETRYDRVSSKWLSPSKAVALREGNRAFRAGQIDEALYLLSFVSAEEEALMSLGKVYFSLKAYREAFSVFIVAVEMGIPSSKEWLDRTAEQILQQ